MRRAPDSLPPAQVIDAVLRKVTESLAAGLVRPSAAAPAWSEFEWNLARGVAAMHGISSLLHRSLRWPDAPEWMEFLAEQRLHTANRHLRIRELLGRIHELTAEAGIPAVALKGAALHALGLYGAGDRPMADVDLLVRPEDAQRTARMIESLGYFESCASWKERAFTPAGETSPSRLGEHTDNMVKIELHTRIAEKLPLRITDITAFVISPQQLPGLNAYPSNAALMMHLLFHAAGAMSMKILRLVQLHDIALLASHMTVGDWGELLAFRAPQPLWWASPPLELTLRYYPAAIPARALEVLGSDCPRHLRRISRTRTLPDISFSHLWVDAFPGIEWSRSPREMVEYVLSRIWPAKEVVALRGALANTQPWASDRDWSARSQARRILTWITTRQARPVTMHVVRAALGVAHG